MISSSPGATTSIPAEVEDVLLAHPAVAEVAVTGTPSDEWGETVTAWVVADGHPPSTEELRAFASGLLAPYKWPRLVHFVDELPRNAMGNFAGPTCAPRRVAGRIWSPMEADAGREHYQVSVTAPSEMEAGSLGRMAVEHRLASCAQVSGPIASTYWWEGEVRSAPEFLCTLKTTSDRLPALIDAIKEAHSYDVPEIVALRMAAGDSTYLAWIEEETENGSHHQSGVGSLGGIASPPCRCT